MCGHSEQVDRPISDYRYAFGEEPEEGRSAAVVRDVDVTRSNAGDECEPGA